MTRLPNNKLKQTKPNQTNFTRKLNSKQLAVFDKDNDGSVDVRELMHAADMYAESKKTSKRLTIFSGLLLLILCALVGVIVGLTAVVVEESKESKAESDGSLKKKGSSKDITVGTSTLTTDVFDSIGMPASSLSSITTLTLTVGTTTRSYTVTGFTKTPSKVTYNTPSGYSIVVTKDKYEIVNAATGKTVAETKKSGSRRRALLQAGKIPTDNMKMTVDTNTNDAKAPCTGTMTYCDLPEKKGCMNPGECVMPFGADNSTTVVCDALTGTGGEDGEIMCESFPQCEWYQYPASPNPGEKIVSFCDEPNTPDEILCPKIMKKDDCDYLPHCKFGATCMAKTDNDRCQELTPATCNDGIHMDDDHIDCKYDDTTAGPGKVIGCVHDHGDHHDHDHGTPATCTGTMTYCAMTETCVPPGTCEDMPTTMPATCPGTMTICGKTKTCMMPEDCDNMPTMPATGMRRKLADGVECSVHAHCASGYCHTPQCFMSASKSAECKKLCMEKSWWSKSDKASITN